MKLKNETELANTQRKLAGLEKLIRKREQAGDDSPAHELSLESMRRFTANFARKSTSTRGRVKQPDLYPLSVLIVTGRFLKKHLP